MGTRHPIVALVIGEATQPSTTSWQGVSRSKAFAQTLAGSQYARSLYFRNVSDEGELTGDAAACDSCWRLPACW